MKKTEYRAEVIGCTLSSKNQFNKRFQKLLDDYAAKGWKLHSYHFASENFCSAVFEREREE